MNPEGMTVQSLPLLYLIGLGALGTGIILQS